MNFLRSPRAINGITIKGTSSLKVMLSRVKTLGCLNSCMTNASCKNSSAFCISCKPSVNRQTLYSNVVKINNYIPGAIMMPIIGFSLDFPYQLFSTFCIPGSLQVKISALIWQIPIQLRIRSRPGVVQKSNHQCKTLCCSMWSKSRPCPLGYRTSTRKLSHLRS